MPPKKTTAATTAAAPKRKLLKTYTKATVRARAAALPDGDTIVVQLPAPKRRAAATNTASQPAAKRPRTAKEARPAKRVASKPPPKPRAPKRAAINRVSTRDLDIYVFGDGHVGELGLGNKVINGEKPVEVSRPRLHHNLPADYIGVVDVACGGLHAAAITRDKGVLLTWGLNDDGALGRDTTWDGPDPAIMQGNGDFDDSDDSDDGRDLNPEECTPRLVPMDHLGEPIEWTQVVACDSATFALDEHGRVFGWGTFRSSSGRLGFSQTVETQLTPTIIPDLDYIVRLAAGSNHVLALDRHGRIHSYGCGEHGQLARRWNVHAPRRSALRALGVGSLPRRGARAVKIACGAYHSFALDEQGRVYAWGLNNFGQLGIRDGAGVDHAMVQRPCLVEALAGHHVVDIASGDHHSLACTKEGKLLTWGRVDYHQTGLYSWDHNDQNTLFDDRGRPRALVMPTVVGGMPRIRSVGAGANHCLAISDEGRAYSWGFSMGFQTGQGTDDDVEHPTLLDNPAIHDKEMRLADGGGAFSILAG